jgi:hypothetical protein
MVRRPPTNGLVVAGAGEAVATADVMAGADGAGPGAPSSEPDEHASGTAVMTTDAARMRRHDDTRPR